MYRNIITINKLLIYFLLLITCKAIIAEESSEKQLPESTPGVITINVEQLLELINTTPDLSIIDARIESSREKGYIESSVSLLDIETNCASLAKIIPNLSSITIFYCGSSSCGRSLNSVRIAQQCGYKNLYWFRGGFKAWKQHGLPYIK